MTRYRSGGVGGTEKDGLKGVGGLVCDLDDDPPINVSLCRCAGDLIVGGAPIVADCPRSRAGV